VKTEAKANGQSFRIQKPKPKPKTKKLTFLFGLVWFLGENALHESPLYRTHTHVARMS